MMPSLKSTIVVAMSGGVDSSVAALLLKQQGYRVIGLYMKNWEEQGGDGICQSAKEYADVVRVCGQLEIPYYSVNFVQAYRDNVFTHFVEEFKLGHTPNPDILCNREIKFKVLLQKALELGGDYLATGHYCQIGYHDDGLKLLKGIDPGKDQSYFLHAIDGKALEKVLFPIGHLHKSSLRDIARSHGIATAEKKDSTGICFIGKRDFKTFLGQYIQYQPGNFENLKGEVVGRHDGVAFYTPGQRRGMGIGGAGDAWFVIGKDISRNVVIVDQGKFHPALFCDGTTVTDLTWISGQPPKEYPYHCHSKVRYRQPDQECTIDSIGSEKTVISFSVPQRAVTPRQSVVFYDGNICLGGGLIDTPGASYHAQGKPLPDIVSP